MKIWTGEPYKGNDREVEVVEVSGSRVQFKEIVRWDFGWWHTRNITESTTVELFEAEFSPIDVPHC